MLCHVLLLWMISRTEGTLDSRYVKTRVIKELKRCKESMMPLADVLSSDFIGCGVECTANKECRRFMFDTETNLCSLFDFGANCPTGEHVDNKVCYRQEFVCNEVSCFRCPLGYYGDRCQHVATECAEVKGTLMDIDQNQHVLAFIRPSPTGPVIQVRCAIKSTGWWTAIQRRRKGCKEVDFNRTWDEYVDGFGDTHGEYWLGLKHAYDIIQLKGPCRLLIVWWLNDKTRHSAYYNGFNLTDASNGYNISLSGMQERDNATDYLTDGSYSIAGRPFSTYDRDFSGYGCPERLNGGWWYPRTPNCSLMNPSGRLLEDDTEASLRWDDNLINASKAYSFTLNVQCSY
ncbi:hypothetical protein SNE40_005301 [Patella caerulea]